MDPRARGGGGRGEAGTHGASLESLGDLLGFTAVEVSGASRWWLALVHTWVHPFRDSGFHFRATLCFPLLGTWHPAAPT